MSLLESDPALTAPEPHTAASARPWKITAAVLAAALAGALVALVLVTRPPVPENAVRAGIALDDLTITLPDHPLPDGVPLLLDVTNLGALPHDLVIDGIAQTPVLAPGESARLELGSLLPGVYRVHCDVDGHAEAGMVAELVVADAAARDHDH